MAPDGSEAPLTGTVEVDETYIGGKPRVKGDSKRGRGTSRDFPVFAAVQRTGGIRRRVVADVTGATLKQAIREEVDRSARICSDEWPGYRGIGKEFAGGHDVVEHRVRNTFAATFTQTLPKAAMLS